MIMADTIYAPATAPGKAGVAVIRVSGPAAGAAALALCGKLPPVRQATLAQLRDPATGEALDAALALWFAAPHSFTGEDVLELQTHGGRAVVAGVLAALARVPGQNGKLRPAWPGEFSRRAFDNGKLDLTEVEGLADLIEAETDGQRRQALRQLEGGLSTLYKDWQDRLVKVLAHLEAYLDFPDEEIPASVTAAANAAVAEVRAAIAGHLADSRKGERLREGVHIAIIGPPNAGKSSLLNWLARQEVAIVSETPGTTRDVVAVQMELAGAPVTLYDTAGLRETADSIEAEGIRRARARAETADLKIWVFDGNAVDAAQLAAAQADPDALIVLNKVDLQERGDG